MRREPAQNCVGTVAFLYRDGEGRLFKDLMSARWAGSPEAAPLQGLIAAENPVSLTIWDTSRLSIISRIDIPAGEQEDLDIAVRCDDDAEAYAFNNDSYRFLWKNPNWKLPSDRYLVEVTVRCSGEKVSRRFRLYNDLSRDQFRLEDIDS